MQSLFLLFNSSEPESIIHRTNLFHPFQNRFQSLFRPSAYIQFAEQTLYKIYSKFLPDSCRPNRNI